MNTTTNWCCRLGLATLLAIGSTPQVRGQSNDPGELTAQWWQWALSIPNSVNPMVDSDGRNCMIGQRGPIWFLAGTFFGGAATRSCSIPEGTTVFFPVVNAVNFSTPGVCGQVAQTVTQLRAASRAVIQNVTRMTVEVDNRAFTNIQRIQSSVFPVVLPEDNVFDSLCAPANVPAAVYSPGVDLGYYVTLQSLAVGSHSIHFRAEFASGDPVDVTYTITVVPVLNK